MKKTLLSLFTFVSIVNTGFASNSYEKLNSDLIKSEKLINVVDLDFKIRGLCTGYIIVLNADGTFMGIHMTSVDTKNAIDCAEKFRSFTEEVSHSFRIVSTSSGYDEYGPK